MTNRKNSLLVSKQVPQYVRDEYPKFISFLEAYYEFLEQEYPALSISNNNLLEQAEKLRYISDVDESLDSFESHFFNSFLPYLPKNTAANKDIIIKNIMPLYLAKGSEKSFKLLFRMLFDETATLSYPRDNILRASDGRWQVQKVLNVSDEFYSLYVSDGSKVTYYLPEYYNESQFVVYVDDAVTADYLFFKDYKRIQFNTAPSENSIIKIVFLNFNVALLSNRLVEGLTTGASCVIENVTETRTGLTPYFEVFLTEKNLIGSFSNNEVLKSILIQEEEIPIYYKPYSIINTITIIDGGASYNVGDIIPIYGESEESAIITVGDVTSGVVDTVTIDSGGIGFKINDNVTAIGYTTVGFNAKVLTVDTTGITSSNTVTLNDDVIRDYLNVSLSNAYGFLANTSATLTARIDETLNFITITDLGPITSVNVISSTINSTLTPVFDAVPVSITPTLNLKDFGVIGKIDINDGGANYNVGEYLIFTDNGSFAGYGANAIISNVDANGAITQILINSGGISYDQDNFPIITVDTVSGNGANLTVNNIMGDGEIILPVYANTPSGQIVNIDIIYPGLNYTSVPVIDLSQLGNGQAIAEASLKQSLNSLPGRWKTNDGKISSKEINLQGRDYYIDFSYLISSQVEFKAYKDIVKNLLHPAGFINYSRYTVPLVEVSSPTSINIESTVTTS